jgi:membrane protease YdiL (CAAX protease family)
LYALALLVVAALSGMPLGGDALVAGAVALAGILLYSLLAAALGVLAANPLETVALRQTRPGPQWFYLLLASTYPLAFYAPSIRLTVVQVVLTALLALAFWQKALDRVPYLLEPADSPPPRVSLADGLLAALGFVVLQAPASLLLALTGLSPGAQVVLAFATSGAVVVGAALFLLRKVPGLLVVTGLLAPRAERRPAAWRALVPGLLAGVGAVLFASAYLAVIGRIGPLRPLIEGHPIREVRGLFALAVLAVLAAPLVEEFIFRGLVYQGLRRSFRPGFAAVASAALFALIHPGIMALPAFVLGVATALSFERTRRLLTPVAAHVAYNATLVAAGWVL